MALTQNSYQNLLNFTLYTMKFHNRHHAMNYNEKSHIGKCSHLHRLVDWCCRSVFLSHYCLASLQPYNPGQRKRENGRKKIKIMQNKTNHRISNSVQKVVEIHSVSGEIPQIFVSEWSKPKDFFIPYQSNSLYMIFFTIIYLINNYYYDHFQFIQWKKPLRKKHT